MILPIVVKSPSTPSTVCADPYCKRNPVITSSIINNAPLFRVSSRSPFKNPSPAGLHPCSPPPAPQSPPQSCPCALQTTSPRSPGCCTEHLMSARPAPAAPPDTLQSPASPDPTPPATKNC